MLKQTEQRFYIILCCKSNLVQKGMEGH